MLQFIGAFVLAAIIFFFWRFRKPSKKEEYGSKFLFISKELQNGDYHRRINHIKTYTSEVVIPTMTKNLKEFKETASIKRLALNNVEIRALYKLINQVKELG